VSTGWIVVADVSVGRSWPESSAAKLYLSVRLSKPPTLIAVTPKGLAARPGCGAMPAASQITASRSSALRSDRTANQRLEHGTRRCRRQEDRVALAPDRVKRNKPRTPGLDQMLAEPVVGELSLVVAGGPDQLVENLSDGQRQVIGILG
jgi:hypothetical protein